MTTVGWVFMLSSWTVLTVVLLYCYSKIFRTRERQQPRLRQHDPEI